MTNDRDANVRKVAQMMRDLDFCMLTTRSDDGRLHARPMSNNGEVEFDGDVWFFSGADTRKVKEIEAEPAVELSYADLEEYRFISMSGRAAIVRDAVKKRALWIPDLERWFDGGPDDEGIVLIKVSPTVVEYWNGEDGGEIRLD